MDLEIEHDGIKLYSAGLGYFPRNFTRDSVISGVLSSDAELLKNQLIFSARKQGKVKNPGTGEEPGKIFHEYPGVTIRGLSTFFNACDSTALFLIGHSFYRKLANDGSLLEEQESNILGAVNYIIAHLDDNFLFVEDPKFCGANSFALKTTYWKDSQILCRIYTEPVYPITYSLAHAQNLAGLRAAAALGVKGLDGYIQGMKNAIQLLVDDKLGFLFMGKDGQGPISCISSDALHSLFYLEQGDLASGFLKQIEECSKKLETTLGYRVLESEAATMAEDKFHAQTVWPFEQAVIHSGALKFGLKRAVEVSGRMNEHLDTAPELFLLMDGQFTKGNSDPQLWTIAAKKYFESPKPIKFY